VQVLQPARVSRRDRVGWRQLHLLEGLSLQKMPAQKTALDSRCLSSDTVVSACWIYYEPLGGFELLPIERMLEISAKPMENAG
jgi:hypothetical protein